MRELTEQQAEFVTHYTSTPGAIGNAAEAARRAGYSAASARDIGSQLLGKPHVRAAVDEANRAALGGDLASLAMAVLRDILRPESDAPHKVKLDAAKTVLDRAGLTARAADAGSGGGAGPDRPASAEGATQGRAGKAADEAEEAGEDLAELMGQLGLRPLSERSGGAP